MKVKSTLNGNVKITLTPEQARVLEDLLCNESYPADRSDVAMLDKLFEKLLDHRLP